MRRTQQQKLKLALEQDRDLVSREQTHLISIQNERQADLQLKSIMQSQYSQMLNSTDNAKQRGKRQNLIKIYY